MQLFVDLVKTEFLPQQLKKKRAKGCIQDNIEKIREHGGLTLHSLLKAESIHEVKGHLFIVIYFKDVEKSLGLL